MLSLVACFFMVIIFWCWKKNVGAYSKCEAVSDANVAFFFPFLFFFLFFSVCFVGFGCSFLLFLINVAVCYLLFHSNRLCFWSMLRFVTFFFMVIIFWCWKKNVGSCSKCYLRMKVWCLKVVLLKSCDELQVHPLNHWNWLWLPNFTGSGDL